MILHDTHSVLSTRCHLLEAGDIRLVYTEEAWARRQEDTLRGRDSTIADFELWTVESVNKRGRVFVETREGERREISWAKGGDVIKILVEGPDPLYASTDELRALGWKLTREMWDTGARRTAA